MKPNATSLIRKLGVLGILSVLSFAAAVFIAPTAYPGYHWLGQAVSDLSAANAPSRVLWNQLSSLHNPCALAMLMLCVVFVQGQLNRCLRTGLYLFTAMSWISAVGYVLFPLTDSGYAATFQDRMHLVVTGLVVLLSVLAMGCFMLGGFRHHALPSLGVWAAVALGAMFAGPLGMNFFPPAYFGLFERFSVFSATVFTAVLGVYLMRGFPMRNPERTQA